MDQPLVNQNLYPNSIDVANPEIQSNINIEDNQFQNQGQHQSNQQNIDLPPEEPFYLSSPNTNIPYEKPIKSQQNEENHSTQNTLLFPAQPNYTEPQITKTNYPNEEEFKTQPVNNIGNQKYKNFSEIRHKGISHPNENTFDIETSCYYKCFPFLLCFIGLLFISLILTKKTELVLIGLVGFCFLLCGLLSLFIIYTNVSFIMGPNNLIIVKKSFCSKKTLIYNKGQLLRIDFIFTFLPRGTSHNYRLEVILINGKSVLILALGSSYSLFTKQEINYFLYKVNNHIQTKMQD